MRKFNFRLDTLLRVRERTLDAAASELRNVEVEIDSAWQYVRRIRGEQVRLEEETLRKIGSARAGSAEEDEARTTPGESGTLTAAELRERQAYAEFLRRQLEMGRGRISSLNEAREEKRNEWRQRRRDWKVIQKMMDRDRTRWQKENAREEQKAIDEVAQNGSVAGTARSSRPGGPSGPADTPETGSVLKGLLVGVLVAALTLSILYSIRLISDGRTVPLASGFKEVKPATLQSHEFSVPAGKVASGTEARVADLSEYTGITIPSEVIQETLHRIEDERVRLEEKEARLDAWEKRLTRRQNELDILDEEHRALREEIGADLARQQALKEWREGEERRQREENIRRLARLYEHTRAREAARMMLELDKEHAQDVLISMNDRQAVRIVGEMSKVNPHRATELLKSLSEDAGRLAPDTVGQ